jgi:hypothetical protein
MLLERERTGVVDAVERLGGMQAQEPRPPFIGLWSRLEGFQPADLRGALHDRLLVRGMAMRATLHLMSAADYRAVRIALDPVMAAAMRALGARAEGLDLDRVLTAARALLERGPRTFAEIRDHLVSVFPEVDERALGYAVRTRMPLVMVPTDDPWGFPATAAFTLAEPWIGAPLDPAATGETLALAHLAAFGPASAADVQTWCGLPGMAAVLEGLRPRLRAFRDDAGRELFDLPGAPRPDEDVPAPARFLPEFDSLVLAHADRSRVISDEHRGGLVTKNLRVRATFLWDGFAAGTWTVERTKARAVLVMAPFSRLPKAAQHALATEGERLLRATEDGRAPDIRIAAMI